MSDAPRWLNISTIEYNNVLYFDNSWDGDFKYFAKGNGPGSCATYLEVKDFGINISGNDRQQIKDGLATVSDFLSNDMGKAAIVDVYELKKSDPANNICEYDHSPVAAIDKYRAYIWHYLSTDGNIYPFFSTGAGNEIEFIQTYTKTAEDPDLYRATNRAQCPLEIEIGSSFDQGLATGPWKLRYPNSEQGTGCFEQGVFGSFIQQTPPPEVIPPPPTTAPGSESAPTCESEGGPFAWLLCSGFNLAIDSLQFMYNTLIKPLLAFHPLNTTSANNEQVALRSIWEGFRTIANIGFVIVFIVMIFAQTTSVGVDAYTIKKILPRLAIGVILVQLSFFLVAALVDVFNVLGAGIGSLILQPITNAGISTNIQLSGETAAFGLASITATGIAAGAGLFALSPIIFGVVLGIATAVVTLLFRQLLIVLLVVTAPIAMVAFVLPNTEKFFRTWFSFLTKALLMYPLIIALIDLGALGGSVASSTFPAQGSVPSVPGQVMGLVAFAAPYLLIPFTFRFAGGALASISAFAQGKARGGIGKRFSEGRQAKAALRKQNLATGNYSARNPFTRGIGRASQGLALGFRGRYGLGKRGEQAAALRGGAGVEQTLKNNPLLTQLANTDDNANALLALSGGTAGGLTQAGKDLEDAWVASGKYRTREEARAEVERATQAARAVGVTRANAEVALSTMAQNKSRAVAAGQHGVIARGVDRLAAGNDQKRKALEGTYQFNSRNAGRIDLGATWRDGARIKSAHEVMLDGLGRTEMPALVRGHEEQVKQAVTTLTDVIQNGSGEEREKAALRLLELQSALPYATGENAGVINEGMAQLVDFNETEQRQVVGAGGQTRTVTVPVTLEEQLARLVGTGVTPTTLRSNARVYDQQRTREELQRNP